MAARRSMYTFLADPGTLQQQQQQMADNIQDGAENLANTFLIKMLTDFHKFVQREPRLETFKDSRY